MLVAEAESADERTPPHRRCPGGGRSRRTLHAFAIIIARVAIVFRAIIIAIIEILHSQRSDPGHERIVQREHLGGGRVQPGQPAERERARRDAPARVAQNRQNRQSIVLLWPAPYGSRGPPRPAQHAGVDLGRRERPVRAGEQVGQVRRAQRRRAQPCRTRSWK